MMTRKRIFACSKDVANMNKLLENTALNFLIFSHEMNAHFLILGNCTKKLQPFVASMMAVIVIVPNM